MRRISLTLFITIFGLLISAFLLAADKPPAGVHPIVEASIDNDNFFGGTVDGKWIGSVEMMPKIKGGEQYRLYTPSKLLGPVTGGKPTYNEDEPGSPSISLEIPKSITLPKEECVIAVCGEWNALPRIPKLQSTRQKVYQDAVRALLKEHGISKAPVNITRILRIDLEGDGTDEVLIAATTPRKNYPDPSPRKNDYSLVVCRKIVGGKVVTFSISSEYYKEDVDFAAPNAFTLESVFDVNGDGNMEIILGWHYYEGVGKSIIEVKGTKVESVLSNGFAV